MFSLGVAVLGVAPLLDAAVFAESTSPNYRVDEYFFGTGGELDASSPNYKARQTAGEMTVGNAFGANYQFQGGFNTTDDPLLEVAVDGGVFDLGNLDAFATKSASTTFSVRSYLSAGYSVRIVGGPPHNSSGPGYTLPAVAALAASTPGIEQFGINLADNTSPNTGAEPQQVPDGTFSFGAVAAGYDTPDMFKFVSGDTVAFSNTSSGQTVYTLSFIANVAELTPAGQYQGSLSVIVVPTF